MHLTKDNLFVVNYRAHSALHTIYVYIVSKDKNLGQVWIGSFRSVI